MKQPQKWLAAALIALLNQAAWADDVPDLQKTLQSARQGNAAAQFNLGLMYDKGQGGVRQDHAEAVKWYRQSAKQGFVLAQYNLGVMYDRGLGVRKDDTQAVKWYRQAAQQGFTKPNLIWVRCITTGWAYAKIMHRRPNGFAKRHNRAMPEPNTIWV